MALKQRIQEDLKTALLSGNRTTAEVLRGLKAAILNEEVAQGTRDSGLSDDAVEKLIAKEVKKRHESATLYEKGGRAELAITERQEADILSEYLPEQLSEEGLREIIAVTIAGSTTEGAQAMGQVIGLVKQQVGNRADGATIARLVKEAVDM